MLSQNSVHIQGQPDFSVFVYFFWGRYKSHPSLEILPDIISNFVVPRQGHILVTWGGGDRVIHQGSVASFENVVTLTMTPYPL
jgi:hypothetical protein